MQRSLGYFDEVEASLKDASRLFLGAFAAVAILQQMKVEFSSVPMKLIMDNWSYWTHMFWSWLASLLSLQIAPITSKTLTATLVVVAIFERGRRAQQIVDLQEEFPKTGIGLLQTLIASVAVVIILVAGLIVLFAGTAQEVKALGTAEWLFNYSLFGVMGIYGTRAIVHTPRAFFACVLAGVAILAIDRIPLLPQAL